MMPCYPSYLAAGPERFDTDAKRPVSPNSKVQLILIIKNAIV